MNMAMLRRLKLGALVGKLGIESYVKQANKKGGGK